MKKIIIGTCTECPYKIPIFGEGLPIYGESGCITGYECGQWIERPRLNCEFMGIPPLCPLDGIVQEGE